MNQTKNYQLNQWEKTDRIQMEDFNADNAKIDTAMKAIHDDLTAKLAALDIQHVCTGSYIGDSTSNRTVSLPFTPKFLILIGYYGAASEYSVISFIIPGSELCITKSSFYFSNAVSLIENGFRLTTYNWHNVSNYTEQYVAFQ